MRLLIYGVAVVLKGAIIATAAVLLDINFWRAVIIAVVSAVITGAFLLLVAIVQDKREQRFERRLDVLEQHSRDIAGATGATKRATDG